MKYRTILAFLSMICFFVLCSDYAVAQGTIASAVKVPDKKTSSSLLIPKSLFESEKKSAPKPKEEPVIEKNVSLSDYMKTFPHDYLTTYMTALNALNDPKISISDFDSRSGEINAVYNNVKGLYVMVIPESDKSTIVRITPYDGIYDLPDDLIDVIFSRMRKKGLK